VLHIAPERNLQRILSRCTGLEYITADISSPLAAIKLDVTSIGYPDNEFDVIMCNHVLEHVADDAAAMSELMRVLKPGGWAILQVPIALAQESTDEDPTVVDPDEREARFGQYDHVRLYGRDYVARLERAGFSVEQFRAIEQFGEAQVHRNGLQPEETLFVCSKPVLHDVSRPSEVPAAGAQSKDDPQHETSAGARSNRVH
jgi:SAM-dependent methyltransferase